MPKQWYSVHEILIKKSKQDDDENSTYSAPQSTLRPGFVIAASEVLKEDVMGSAEAASP